jgi:transposase
MGGADMAQATRWVGLDVHATQSARAVLDTATGELETGSVAGRPLQVLDWLRGLPRPWIGVYEAGPCGYGLARAAAAEGFDLRVCSPGHATRSPQERIKTDKRDAIRLARLLAAGQLVVVDVPSLADEQVRDVVRAREDVRGDLMRTRHRIGKLLIRRDLYYPHRGSSWTRRHLDWLRSLRLGDAGSELVLADLLHAHEHLVARRGTLDHALDELARTSHLAPQVARLRCLRGIDTLSAIGLAAEIRRFERFAHPDLLASYLGLVPSEITSNDKRRQGAITKAGSRHARRLLVEAAWHYARPPRTSSTLERRQTDASPAVIDCAWRAQRRLYHRWQTLRGQRQKRGGIVAIAVARELAHYCWEITTIA